MINIIREIPGFINWKVINELKHGWSNDKKYYIETYNGDKLLLRISNSNKKDMKTREFHTLKKLNHLKLNCSKPLEYGISKCNKYVYILYSWINGDDLSSTLLTKPSKDQYLLGINAEKALFEIHKSLNIEDNNGTWSKRYNKKIDKKLLQYQECKTHFNGSEKVIEYIYNNRILLDNRPLSGHHGDFHIGNMLIDNKGKLGIVDFDRFDIGDPWEEFNRITWCADISSYFATGRIDGYFHNNVPDDFIKLLALYIGVNQLSSIPWAIPFGAEQIEVMLKQAMKVMSDFNDFTTYIPQWYKKPV